MANRSISKTNDVKKEIESQSSSSNKGKLVPMELDLTSLESVREFSQKFLATEQKIHLLINNAGTLLNNFSNKSRSCTG